ncbi:MAG: tetratricopeptide repeat protein [Candidatus Hydrogenedentota bacterium]
MRIVKDSKLRLKPLILAGVGTVLLMVLTAGCVSGPRSTSPETRGGRQTLADDGAAEREIEQAREMLEEGDYGSAIPRLQHTMEKYRRGEAAKEARYLLGQSYYGISNYRDAAKMLREYLQVAPDSPRAAEARRLMTQIEEEYEATFPSSEELDERIAEVRADVEDNPGDVSKKLELADLLWRKGDYEEAGEIYEEVVAENPSYAEQSPISKRVEVQPEGELALLTPAEVQQREVEDRPLVITNVESFRPSASRDLFTREHRHYVVSGQALNRSDRTLNGVQVRVTIYGFGNVVYDTETVNIGRLGAGERRPFSVRFRDFDTIENIHRHEAVGTFEG